MNNEMVSIIIPVYNQFESLKIVMYGFSQQDYPKEKFEIIVIDDGSTDALTDFNIEYYTKNFGLTVCIIHQNNKGRACARNVGIYHAKGDIIIFCDGDRVPDNKFISEHVKMHVGKSSVVVGAAYDYFGVSNNITDKGIAWDKVTKLSRLSAYYKKIALMYDDNGKSNSEIVWLSFLVGNSSVSRDVITVEQFDESFTEWGFEHFELAYRLFKKNIMFCYNEDAKNYHIPHKREKGFYEEQIKKSAKLLTDIHKEIDSTVLADFVYSNLSIEQALQKIIVLDK